MPGVASWQDVQAYLVNTAWTQDGVGWVDPPMGGVDPPVEPGDPPICAVAPPVEPGDPPVGSGAPTVLSGFDDGSGSGESPMDPEPQAVTQHAAKRHRTKPGDDGLEGMRRKCDRGVA